MNGQQTAYGLRALTGRDPDDDAQTAVELLLDFIEGDTQRDGSAVVAAYRDAEARIARERNA